MHATWCIRRLCSFPSVFAITLLSPFTIHHLVIDEIPPGSHLTHIPDLQTRKLQEQSPEAVPLITI